MALPEWVNVATLTGLVAPDKQPDSIEWSIERALRAFASVATIPDPPTDQQVTFLEDAIVAWIEWHADTGGATAGLRIGHVEIPDTNASTAGVVGLPSNVWAFLRSAGVLRVARARAY